MLQNNHDIINTVEQMQELVERIRLSDVLAIDVETTGLSHRKHDVCGIALSPEEGYARYVALGHPGKNVPLQIVQDMLLPEIQNPKRQFVFHNAKFDTLFMAKIGLDIPYGQIDDTMLEAYSTGQYALHGLKHLVKTVFDYKMVEFKDLFPGNSKLRNAGRLRSDIVGPYACDDVDYTLRLHYHFYPQVRSHPTYRLERRLWPVVQWIEGNGFSVNRNYLSSQASLLKMEADKLEKAIRDSVAYQLGRQIGFNLNSNQDVSDLLYGALQLPVVSTTKDGSPSTDEATLKKLASQGSRIAEAIALHRSMQNAVTDLGKTLYDMVDEGRIYTEYNQIGASTGRFSSSKPNLQNISKKKVWVMKSGKRNLVDTSVEVRKAFRADEGHYLIELDFKQIEFICIAYMAGETELVAKYMQGLDPHILNASDMYGIAYDDVTLEQREDGKVANFFIIYLGSVGGLAQKFGCSKEEAERRMERLFTRYPGFKKFNRTVMDNAKKLKKVESHFGRKLYMESLYSDLFYERKNGERSSVNWAVQSTAADIHKAGLIGTYRAVRQTIADGSVPNLRSFDDAKMVAHIHDSQAWSVDKRVKPQDIIPVLVHGMTPPDGMKFPKILIDAKIGLNWAELHDYDAHIEYNDDFWDAIAWDEPFVPETNANNNGVLDYATLDLNDVDDIDGAIDDLASLLFGSEVTKVDIKFPNTMKSNVNKPITISLTPDELEDVMRIRFPSAVVHKEREIGTVSLTH